MKASVVISYAEPDARLLLCQWHVLQNHPFELLSFSGGSEAEDAQRGLEAASGDVVLFTNSDAYVPPDWIEQHLRYYPEFDVVLGATAYSLKSLALRNFSGKREVLLRYGFKPLGEERGANFDTELGIRMIRGGVKAKIDNSITVMHDHPKGGPVSERFRRKFGAALVMVKMGEKPDMQDLRHALDWMKSYE